MSKKFTSYQLVGMKVQFLCHKQPVVDERSQLLRVLSLVLQ